MPSRLFDFIRVDRLSGIFFLFLLVPNLLYGAETIAAGPTKPPSSKKQAVSNVKALQTAPSKKAIKREIESIEDPLTQRQIEEVNRFRIIRLLPGKWDWYASARLRYRNGGRDDWLFGDGGSRIGLHGSYRFFSNYRIFGTFEAGFSLADELDALLNPGDQSGTDTTFFARLGYVGLETPKLNINAGKNWSTYYQVASFTDKLIAYGGEGTQFANAETDGGSTGTGRADQVLQGRFMINAIPDNWWFKPFRLNLQVQDGRPIPEVSGVKYGTSFGASAILHLVNEFVLGIAYNRAPINLSNAVHNAVHNAGIRGNEQALLLGSRWFDDNWYVGANLSRLKNHATTDTGQYFNGIGAELYGKYRILPKLWLFGGWNYLRPDSASTQAGEFKIDYLVPGLLYEVRGPDKLIYLEYKLSGGRHSDGSAIDDVLTVGIRWDFSRSE